MVPFFRRVSMALAVAAVLVFVVGAGVAQAVPIVCNQACNTCLVCSTPTGTCTVSNDLEAPAGCELDFGSRNVVFKGTFDVGSAKLNVKAHNITVQGQLKARSDGIARGGEINLTATGDILVTAGRIDVTGNSAGIMRLDAAGKIDLQSTTPLVANGNQGTAGGGTINVTAGTFIRQGGDVSATGGGQADGGNIKFDATTDLTILKTIDATGGINDGGDVDLIAGDDIAIAQTIDVSAVNGGSGGPCRGTRAWRWREARGCAADLGEFEGRRQQRPRRRTRRRRHLAVGARSVDDLGRDSRDRR